MMIRVGDFGKILSFGRAVFNSGQSTSAHVHTEMTDVFFILSGRGVFHNKREKIEVEEDDYITIPA